MNRPEIQIEHLTKDYGHGRGVFDISIALQQGECYGFLGPNGAGKTTTIRHLMGFSKPDSGRTFIQGKDCWDCSADLKHRVGYLPGEIALPSGITGEGFLKMTLRMHHADDVFCRQLLDRFQLDANKKTREMSLGEKRKLAIVAAFMHDPEILILDEPTSGLDPVMQQEFINFVREEKERGKTIFMSSHIFREVDSVCERIAIIKSGRIVSEFLAEELKQTQDMIYALRFGTDSDYRLFKSKGYRLTADSEERLKVKVSIPSSQLNAFVADISAMNVESFHQVQFSLEDYFMEFYKSEEAAL
ncbi:MAG: ABC transporter ATP-binding protein [Firmicutes bacterium]|nr:ABC transporter ATP-binding protein [Bacillota bacterium]